MEKRPAATETVALEGRLPPAALRVVEEAARLATDLGVPVHLVGGPVRDLLLGRPLADLDLVVEGDAARFAGRLAAALGGSLEVHERFGTARVATAAGLAVDVAAARAETYPEPAALPTVRPAGLAEDLRRRDFTVNALAIRLAPAPAPVLVDELGGCRDLERRLLRILHPASFVDDPTRILRGARLGARLGFQFDEETARHAREAAAGGAFEPLSGDRLCGELRLVFAEPDGGGGALERLAELGALDAIAPGWVYDAATRERLAAALAAAAWARANGRPPPRIAAWKLGLLALLAGAPAAVAGGLAARLALAGADRELLAGCAERLARARRRLDRPGLAPHEASAALAGLADEELALAIALGGDLGAWARRELAEMRALELGVSGGDLVARGHPPGPAIGRALAATREARLDGRIRPEEELEFALAELARGAAEPAPTEGRR